ncbi:MAG: hypothetical protein J2P48_20705 [Alphaproteobacteria bacterium]|nr:hypothetical protein [Alphaproteobacteria bacterium]
MALVDVDVARAGTARWQQDLSGDDILSSATPLLFLNDDKAGRLPV